MTDSTEATQAAKQESTEASAAAPESAALTPADIAPGQPLDWPLVDADGTLLLDAGATLVGEMERDFLFRHFAPQRGDLEPPASAPAKPQEPDAALTVRDLHLTIGALMGLRPQQGASGAPMHPCKLIGVAPNEAIFVTLPYVDRRPIEITPGENVEIVAIASHAVYRFVCTIHAMYQAPLGYLVLSKPANIRMLRERKSIRVRAQFPVRYGLGEETAGYQGVALARGISALGLSIAAPWALAKVGERLRLAWRLRSGELDTTVETSAIVRNVHQEDGPEALYTLGLELDSLSPADQMAMKVYVFDRQDDVLYWTGAAR
ncbi:MAG TPA: flagellar brake domain-containing protein [Paraburkholderia sp.]|jgi:c-di-GMP-binding flagellar brake protein YcgR|uniref:flagellar brake protein n=1 Tax=Paraburkholderia sp. TaxID=1926495 RepID=UPI002DEE55D8|nr:flagellar brake domain-containing protein [Paraburkholderia sp.]